MRLQRKACRRSQGHAPSRGAGQRRVAGCSGRSGDERELLHDLSVPLQNRVAELFVLRVDDDALVAEASQAIQLRLHLGGLPGGGRLGRRGRWRGLRWLWSGCGRRRCGPGSLRRRRRRSRAHRCGRRPWARRWRRRGRESRGRRLLPVGVRREGRRIVGDRGRTGQAGAGVRSERLVAAIHGFRTRA